MEPWRLKDENLPYRWRLALGGIVTGYGVYAGKLLLLLF